MFLKRTVEPQHRRNSVYTELGLYEIIQKPPSSNYIGSNRVVKFVLTNVFLSPCTSLGEETRGSEGSTNQGKSLIVGIKDTSQSVSVFGSKTLKEDHRDTNRDMVYTF